MILSFQIDRSGQNADPDQTALLKEQSDKGLHCLLFHLHFFEELLHGKTLLMCVF